MKSDYNGNLLPQEEEGITSAEWIQKERIPEILKNAYENIKVIVEAVADLSFTSSIHTHTHTHI